MTVPPAKNAPEFLPPQVEVAMQRAEAAARRINGRYAPVRRAFIRRISEGPPPLAELVRGGRGGVVRLRLLLSMIWIAAAPPHDTRFPARAWAELLGLPDPDGKGGRRVADAIRWLAAHDLVTVQSEPGAPGRVFLLDESGSGEPYDIPATADKDPFTNRLGQGDWYISLTPDLWVQGWLATLSGAALALLLILIDMKQLDGSDEVWVSERARDDRYGISADTWTKGTRELRHHDLVIVHRRPISGDFDWRRYRNTYIVNLERLSEAPTFTLAKT